MSKRTANKDVEEFLALYKSYEAALRAQDKDYRTVEEASGSDRMRIMRQMRNYLSHADDPGFIAISPVCLEVLRQMVKEEQVKGDIAKNHLVTPAKGSLKEGMPLPAAVYQMVRHMVDGRSEMPVYDEKKQLKGILTLERAAYALNQGHTLLYEKTCGPYSKEFHLLKPDDLVPEKRDGLYYCVTRNGMPHTQYMGYLDI